MRKRIIVGSAIAAAGWAAFFSARRWWETWGRDPDEAARRLPGDELVPDPAAVDTRGITIEAPPSTVWPWLVQMGYGRAGWYSYDRLDMRGRSADAINPAWQELEVGDLLPTDRRGGFVVKVLEPERALVVHIDSATAMAQRRDGGPTGGMRDAPGLAASGAFLENTVPPDFSVSWAFVLEPVEGGMTRLIERVRLGGDGASGTRRMGAMLGFGVFVMTQRQMNGIRARAERAWWTEDEPAAAPTGPAARVDPDEGTIPEGADAVPDASPTPATVG